MTNGTGTPAAPTVKWSRRTATHALNAITFWRKHLLVKIRRPALRKEMRASLAALADEITTDRSR
jgi:hypothetical protein